MATEEWIKRAITNGKVYDDLPPRVRAMLPLSEWKTKVKEHCIQRGSGWGDSLASTACGEQEYYEDLLRFYRHQYRIFPYHLADYVCRVLRVTPFRYYSDLLYTVMREEKSYDQIPNFAAADAVRLVGIGRNEYIAIMNKVKAKKLLWRVNKAIVKELLPEQPLDIDMQPWWHVGCVNLSETEFRSLSPEELRTVQEAARPGGAVRVADCDRAVLQGLYKRGLIYLDVPIRPSDHVSIPPLEGFVSNKDSDAGGEGERGDPLERLLYTVFVATSARAAVAELAQILSVDLPKLQCAISIACRLGFATRLPPGGHAGEGGEGPPASPALSGGGEGGGLGLGLGLDLDSEASPSAASGAPGAASSAALDSLAGLDSGSLDGADSAGDGQGIALVVDAEVTSYLMMGALSPGLKRHSVTLFEGGRVTGAEVIAELITELHASVAASGQFEGEMQRLAAYAQALAQTLECVRRAGGGRPVELLRKESLAGLAPAAACRVLSHAYAAVVPIAPLPYPPLPILPNRPGPVNFGPTAEAATPWLQLALYAAARAGLASVTLVAGQRLWRLPPQLARCSHALLWPWDADSVRAQSVPVLVEATFLLFTLNEYLARTAICVQPLALPAGCEEGLAGVTADVALPLRVGAPDATGAATAQAVTGGGQVMEVVLPEGLEAAVCELGLSQALGCIRLLHTARPAPGTTPQVTSALPLPPAGEAGASGGGASGSQWVPLQLQLGLPLMPAQLNELVCRQAEGAGFLEAEVRRRHTEGQADLQRRLYGLISQYGACSNCFNAAGARQSDALAYVDLPIANLLFDGLEIVQLDYADYQQGIAQLCLE